MSLAKVFGWTSVAVLIKLAAGLLVIKLFAVTFGPSGLGLAGNFRQCITVLGVLCGAGIFNGVIKYVAEYHKQPEQLRAILGTSSAIIFGSCSLLALFFLLAATPISIFLFGDDSYQQVVRILALIQMGMALANFFLAILKGYGSAMDHALVLIVGSVMGGSAFYFCLRLYGYTGALTGLALFPVLVFLPAGFVLVYRQVMPLAYLKLHWDKKLAGQLGKFTLMALVTVFTLPLVYIMMRNLLARHYGWNDVGIWQGVSSISDAWLQLVTASFTVYLLPRLSRMQDKAEITHEVIKVLRFVFPVLVTASFTLWLLRDVVIELLFSRQFTAMGSLFAWQLVGDVLKVGCWVFGYLVVARASLCLYVMSEVSQCLLLTGFACWLIPVHGATGAVQAYMATYIIYFMLCSFIFLIYCNKTGKNDHAHSCTGI